MPISEVFPNPTVKEVHFKVHFPSLFFIDKLVGDFQLKIMKDFPRSKEIMRRQVVIADMGKDVKIEDIPNLPGTEPIIRIWRFESESGVSVNLEGGALGIHSTKHKTYANTASKELFREVVDKVIASFLQVASVPTFSRLGLRYVDEIPFPELSDNVFGDHFNTTFPLKRFSICETELMQYFTIVKRGDYKLRFLEQFTLTDDGKYSLMMDFDGFAENIDSHAYLNVTDQLHQMISNEFERSIKDPVFQYMRAKKEE